MTQSKVNQASKQANVLNEETRKVLDNAKKKNTKALVVGMIFYTILLLTILGGYVYQDILANQNKKHIDCIVKLLASPLPPGSRARVLTNPSTTCNIKFSS